MLKKIPKSITLTNCMIARKEAYTLWIDGGN